LEKTILEKVFEKLCYAFKEEKIDYMIIGGQAVLYYGHPRLTEDIDITLGIDISELNKIIKICNKNNILPLPKKIEEFVEKTYVLPCFDNENKIRIDFIFSFFEYERKAISRAKEVSLDNIKIKIAAIEDVIIHKIFSGRPRDIEDIRILMIINNKEKIDRKYIINWLKEFANIPGKENLIEIFLRIEENL